MMKLINITFIFVILFYACSGQKPLTINKKGIICFKPSETEFRERVKKNQNYYELDSDYGAGIAPFIDSLKVKGINLIITSKKFIRIMYSNITFEINLKKGESPYGVILFDGKNFPTIIYGAHPTEYYLDILSKKLK